MSELTYISLFSGIGGMDLGLDRAGMRCVAQVEIDEYCRRVLAKHWPEVPKYADVTKFCRRVYDCEAEDEWGNVHCPRCDTEFGECDCIGTDELLDTAGYPMLIAGGDPCQANSNAKTHGATAASFGGEFIRIVDELRPRFVLRENPSVARKDAPWTWYRFRSELERLGYAVVPFRFRACCAGADHRRERLFLFAELQDADGARLEGHERKVLEDANERRYDADTARPDRWSAAPGVCGKADGVPCRMDRLKGLGNAVVPQVAQFIGECIVRHYEAVST